MWEGLLAHLETELRLESSVLVTLMSLTNQTSCLEQTLGALMSTNDMSLWEALRPYTIPELTPL